MKRPPREAFAVLALAFIVVYLLGGAGGFRQIRSRIRAWLEPPTVEQVRRAPRDTAVSVRIAPTREMVGRKIWLSDPPSTTQMVGALTGIISVAIVLMFATRSRGIVG
jgi:hypothetical protein